MSTPSGYPGPGNDPYATPSQPDQAGSNPYQPTGGYPPAGQYPSQPYGAPGYPPAGAYGAALSGAGSSLLALCDAATAPRIAAAMNACAAELRVEGETLPLAIDRRGLVLTAAD